MYFVSISITRNADCRIKIYGNNFTPLLNDWFEVVIKINWSNKKIQSGSRCTIDNNYLFHVFYVYNKNNRIRWKTIKQQKWIKQYKRYSGRLNHYKHFWESWIRIEWKIHLKRNLLYYTKHRCSPPPWYIIRTFKQIFKQKRSTNIYKFSIRPQ